ncbi:MAG: hypothetical protein HYX75_23875 [Acidobacteria bacterium]|nr:hypothetical protein [Acidobacteriota bacterium]
MDVALYQVMKITGVSARLRRMYVRSSTPVISGIYTSRRITPMESACLS